jgi:hypothetical protein
MRYTTCTPVDPSDRDWVPRYDLDDLRMHPDINLLLQSHLHRFIDFYTRRETFEMKAMFGRVTNELLRVFDFNASFKYDYAAFAMELRVCTSLFFLA